MKWQDDCRKIGRTGITAIVVSFYFLLSIFFAPLLASVCIHTYIDKHTPDTHTHACAHVHTHTHTHTQIHTYLFLSCCFALLLASVCVYTYIETHALFCAAAGVRMCIYMHKHTFTHTHMHTIYDFIYIGATLGDGPGAHHSWRHDDA